MAPRLPEDVWRIVSDFLGGGPLWQVDGTLRRLLEWRHIELRDREAVDLRRRMAMLRPYSSAVCSLALSFPSPDLAPVLDCVRHLTALRSLALDFRQCGAQQLSGPDLSGLGALTSLQSLDLDFGGTAVGPDLVLAVLASPLIPMLRSLTLGLSGTDMNLVAVTRLTLLRSATALTSLSLDLGGNRVAGVLRFATSCCPPRLRYFSLSIEKAPGLSLDTYYMSTMFGNLPHLQSLHLCLAHNRLPQDSMALLCARVSNLTVREIHLDFSHNDLACPDAAKPDLVRDGFLLSSTVEHLRLGLGHSAAGDRGAAFVARLREAHYLRSLQVDLQHSRLTAVGASAIGDLGTIPWLSELEIDLGSNSVGDAGVAGLVGPLRAAEGLQVLRLGLARVGLGDDGAAALATLKEMAWLRILSLRLAHNDIGDRGALALAELQQAPRLRTLQLDLTSNRIGSKGAMALAELPYATCMGTFTLDQNPPPPSCVVS